MIRAEQKVYVGSAQKLKKDRSRRPWRCNTASLNNFCFNKNICMAVTLCKAASTENRYTNCKKAIALANWSSQSKVITCAWTSQF